MPLGTAAGRLSLPISHRSCGEISIARLASALGSAVNKRKLKAQRRDRPTSPAATFYRESELSASPILQDGRCHFDQSLMGVREAGACSDDHFSQWRADYLVAVSTSYSL